MSRNLTAIVFEEDGGFVSLCPELDVASQGETREDAREDARENLKDALEMFFECASATEIERRSNRNIAGDYSAVGCRARSV
jgi:predicted RNase H-like HicB family nuclease